MYAPHAPTLLSCDVLSDVRSRTLADDYVKGEEHKFGDVGKTIGNLDSIELRRPSEAGREGRRERWVQGGGREGGGMSEREGGDR